MYKGQVFVRGRGVVLVRGRGVLLPVRVPRLDAEERVVVPRLTLGRVVRVAVPRVGVVAVVVSEPVGLFGRCA